MTTLDLAALEYMSSTVTQPSVEPAAPVGAMERFADAMQRANTGAPVDAAQQVTPVAASPGADERALEGLDLPGSATMPASGDMILNGLTKLRGVFDQEIGKVNRLMESPAVDAKAMLAVQVEVVNFSLMVDVTSKLTGKTTQALDTLMKGQ